MTLRIELDKQQKKDTIEICNTLIEDINKTLPIEDESVRIMDFLGQEDDQQETGQWQEQVIRGADIKLDFNDQEIQYIPQKQQQRNLIEKEEFVDEGYLYKKEPQSKAWDYRYIRIRKGLCIGISIPIQERHKTNHPSKYG
ncbi:unnamed protein product (macronuclear) [Paramecium tetraurelia]|uniref:Uncharacterized protein n=1 Tax=Paramecium tetraurelia TaxID=5888 RepID=A0C7I7_PARTE|nr:uncharacterized protein GSPATT00035884001 [Paramecium tetraurelia]CAK66754.1 unnamed protein product [Paramecium tetraurelia]|eukprot:XP_001434151.1 hypothetical protein (macronuclear) [Paramecium tetraurelia strain d4-2]